MIVEHPCYGTKDAWLPIGVRQYIVATSIETTLTVFDAGVRGDGDDGDLNAAPRGRDDLDLHTAREAGAEDAASALHSSERRPRLDGASCRAHGRGRGVIEVALTLVGVETRASGAERIGLIAHQGSGEPRSGEG